MSLSFLAIDETVDEADATTGIADGLLEPDHGLRVAFAFILCLIFVFCLAGFVPCRCEWDDDEESVGGARDEGEEVGVGERVDVVEGEGGFKAEGTGEVVHYLWVVFEDGEVLLRPWGSHFGGV